ncbi:MAG: hypothetical protein Fur0023_00400 [Bacteroidia bacterium]
MGTYLFAQNLSKPQNPISAIDTTAKFQNELFTKGNVNWGVKTAYIQSNLYGVDRPFLSVNGQTNALNGFLFGITVNSMISKYIWLKHELNFHLHGAGVTLHDSINGNYNSQLRMYSLQLLPISPAFHIKGFQLYASPYISALLDAYIKRKDKLGNYYTDHSIYGNDKENTQFNKYLQKFDFGIATGVEYEFYFGLNIGVRYTRGFIPIFDNANVNTFSQNNPVIKIYNQAIIFSLGYSPKKKN